MKPVKTIPSILGIIVLLLGLIAGTYLSGKVSFFSPKASSSCVPNNLQVTNLTHNSFDVSFVTDSNCSTQIVVDGRNIFDIRQSQSQPLRQTHYFRISNLKPEQNYNFSITSGGQDYSLDSYQAKTGKTPGGQLPSSNLAWGRILEANGNPSQDAIIYLNIPKSLPLSAFAGVDGRWNISLAFSLTDDKSGWFNPEPGVPEEIVVMSTSSSPTIVSSNTSRNDPVPDIILGKNQDLSTSKQAILPTSIVPTTTLGELTVDNPKENESITSNLPDFFGRGLAGSTINLVLETMTNTIGQVIVSSSGSWRWSPPKALVSGSHTLRVSSLGSTISRHFQVISSDYGLAFSASSSATIAPTIIVPTPTIESTPIPTPTLTPTPQTKKTLPSTSSGVPTTGNPQLTFVIMLVGIIIILSSIKLFKL